MNAFEQIRMFNQIFGLPVNETPTQLFATSEQFNARMRRLKEILIDEINEVDDIVAHKGEDSVDTLTKLADWLGDIIVYAASEMIKFGLSPEEILHIIMQSNFSKLDENGKAIIVNGKVQKGPLFFKPEPEIKRWIINRQAVDLKLKIEESIHGANARQVGGNHYRQAAGVPQHWDLSIMYRWDPFQYQITKYVMRWKDKHPTPEKKLEDLNKARHFLDKYIENYEVYLSPPAPPVSAPQASESAQPPVANEHWQIEGYFGDLTQEYSCVHCKSRVRARFAPGPHGCAPMGSVQAALDASTQAGEPAPGRHTLPPLPL